MLFQKTKPFPALTKHGNGFYSLILSIFFVFRILPIKKERPLLGPLCLLRPIRVFDESTGIPLGGIRYRQPIRALVFLFLSIFTLFIAAQAQERNSFVTFETRNAPFIVEMLLFYLISGKINLFC